VDDGWELAEFADEEAIGFGSSRDADGGYVVKNDENRGNSSADLEQPSTKAKTKYRVVSPSVQHRSGWPTLSIVKNADAARIRRRCGSLGDERAIGFWGWISGS